MSAVEPARNHVVHIYDDEALLCESVARFLFDGAKDGQGVVVVATEAHRAAIVARLGERGVDVARGRSDGSIVLLDAREMLDRLCEGGRPVASRFARIVGDILDAVRDASRGAPTRVYGEMVDLVCRDGDVASAVALEGMWNALASKHAFSLFCGYDKSGLRDDAALAAVCAQHERVVESDERRRLHLVASQRNEMDAESFRLLVDSVVDYAIFMLDARGVVRTWNRGAQRIKGYRAEEIIGRHFSTFYPPEAVAAGTCDELFARATREGRVASEGWRVRKDGTRFWAAVTLTALRDASGELVGVAKVTRDLTEQRRLTEEKLAREAAEHAAAVLSRLHEVAGALAAARSLDEIAEIVVGRAAAAVRATNAVLVRPAGNQLEVVRSTGIGEEIVAAWRRFAISAATPLSAAYRERRPQWTASREDTIARFADVADVATDGAVAALPLVVEGEVTAVVGFRFDRSRELTREDRALLETLAANAAQALGRADAHARERRALEDANRTKEDFLATVSHELRTPLTSIFGWSSILRRASDPVTLAKGLDTIHRAAQAQIKLIDDLLDVSRIVSGKLHVERVSMDLAAIVRAAADIVRPSMDGKTVAFAVHGCDEPAPIDGDPARLQQVVLNLLMNAAKFTPMGGRVDLALDQGGAAYSVTVRDTGRGMAKDFLAHAFERFRQADASTTRTVGGLGLGLAIAKHIVDLHGGTITAESEGEGKGATFVISLPKA